MTEQGIAYWIGSESIGYWQDPSNWENHQIPTANQTVLIKHSKMLRILHDLDTIHAERIIVESAQISADINLLILENPILVSKGIEVGEFSRLVIETSVGCFGENDKICQLNVRGQVVVSDIVGGWNQYPVHRNLFRMQTNLKTPNANFKISTGKYQFHLFNKSIENNCGNSRSCAEIYKEENDFGEAFSSHEFLLFVPSTRNVNEKVSTSELETLLENIVLEISQIVGGVTVLPNQKGYWKSESKGLMSETIHIISVSVPDHLLTRTKKKFKQLAQYILQELNQEAVFIKIDSKAYLITKEIHNR